MHTTFFAVTLAGLLAVGSAAPSTLQAQQTAACKALLESAAASPVTLADILAPMQRGNRRVLRADLMLDTDGQLVAQVLLRVVRNQEASFHLWSGPIFSAGWVPRVRVLEGEAELAEAERLWSLGPTHGAVWNATVNALRKDGPVPRADVVLSAAPSSGRIGDTVDVLAGFRGRLLGLAFDPSTRTLEDKKVAVPTSKPVEAHTIPELEVPEGRWFNAEVAPSLAGLRGRPALVLVTSPDCDDCHDTYPRLNRWYERYAEDGLQVVTVYRAKKMTPESMSRRLKSRKIAHPVLLDPHESYGISLGMRGWPLATLLNRNGRIVWQGRADSSIFPDACDRALAEQMKSKPKNGAGPDSTDR